MMGQAWGERALENKKKNTHKFCVSNAAFRASPALSPQLALSQGVPSHTPPHLEHLST